MPELQHEGSVTEQEPASLSRLIRQYVIIEIVADSVIEIGADSVIEIDADSVIEIGADSVTTFYTSNFKILANASCTSDLRILESVYISKPSLS